MSSNGSSYYYSSQSKSKTAASYSPRPSSSASSSYSSRSSASSLYAHSATSSRNHRYGSKPQVVIHNGGGQINDTDTSSTQNGGYYP